ncbi:LCP family protein [Georgenia sp. SYP-B2076]|uniref:LCP family protein n=1 Tax=Georgenia sp. SYP-B2076 TaxID=2495881 RepID=UPI000F8D905D|nr:LCP family protein [Georgenia sp. SYP-B2076]
MPTASSLPPRADGAPRTRAAARRAAEAPAGSRRHARQASTGPSAPRHARNRRGHHLLGRIGTVALALVLFLGTGGALAYNDIQGNVDRHDITSLLGDDRPAGEGDTVAAPLDAKAGQALNLLVMGSDSRGGANDDHSGVEGMRADTTMLAHISADRSRVEIVSIPRDTLVDVPSCMLPTGVTTKAQRGVMFNSAFAIGGQTGDVGAAAACAIRTVEELTGVFVDDFVVVDFAGFQNMIDALSGVPMYVPEAIKDKQADLELAAGCQVLNGHDALGFARVRKSVGDGSDISRIGRQQELVAAIAREALSKNLLTDLPALYQFLDATTQTLATGQEIGQIPTLAGLANSLRGLDAAGISFATMPFDWAGARVKPSADAETLWAALRADEPIEATLTGTGEAPTEPPTDAPTGTDAEAPSGAATDAPVQASPSAPTADDGAVSAAPEPAVPACTK